MARGGRIKDPPRPRGRKKNEKAGPRERDPYLSFRVPGRDTNRSRWAIAPAWVQLQQAIFVQSATPAVRERAREDDAERVTLMAGGCLAELARLDGVDLRDEAGPLDDLVIFEAAVARLRLRYTTSALRERIQKKIAERGRPGPPAAEDP